MKKLLSVFCTIALFGLFAIPFVACTEVEENTSTEIKELRFNIKVKNASVLDTKVVKTAWEDGDVVYVFFKNNDTHLAPLKYVTLVYNAGENKWNGTPSSALSDVSELGTAGTMYAIYFPFGGVSIAESDTDDDVVSFLSTGSTNPALDNLPIFTYYLSGNASYTIETEGNIGTLTGSLSLEMPEGFVYFFIDKDGSNYNSNEKYRISAEGFVPTACTSYSAGVFEERALLAGQPVWGYAYNGQGIAFSGKIDDSWSSSQDHKFILFSDGDPALSRTMNVKLTSHESVKLKKPNTDNGWSPAIATPNLVDMGTETCYWAECNLGASAETEIGWKLGWGQIVPPNYYLFRDWYPEYNINSDLTGNYRIYDVARAYLGSGWRMPTLTEAENLMNNCTKSYDMAIDYVTLEGNGNTIYFPITEYGRYDNPSAGDEDTGYFWTSNIYNPQQAYYFYVDRYFEEVDYYYLSSSLGLTVRPVKDK